MLNRRELNPPKIPESADPEFFNFERKFSEVQNAFVDLHKAGLFFFLIYLIILMKPVVMLQLSGISSKPGIVFAIIFVCFIGEFFVSDRKLFQNSTVSWIWLPLISLTASALIACTGDFTTASLAFVFTIVETAVVFKLLKFDYFAMPSEQKFFMDKLWQDSEKLGHKRDSEKYAFFRIEKTEEIINIKNAESSLFKRWNILFIYSFIIFAEISFIHSTSNLLGVTGLILFLNVFASSMLIVQILKKKFHPLFLLFFGLLVSLNIYQLFADGYWFLAVIDFSALFFVFVMIYKYFRNLYFIRSINFNYFDLVALLESKNSSISEKCHEILKKNTGFDLPLSMDLWLNKLVETQNAEHNF